VRAQPFLEIFSREQYRMYVRVELKLAASQGNAMVQALDAREITSCYVYGIRPGEMRGKFAKQCRLAFL